MNAGLFGVSTFFSVVGAMFAFAPGQIAARALANNDPGPKGLRGIRTGGYLLLGLAALLALFSISKFATE